MDFRLWFDAMQRAYVIDMGTHSQPSAIVVLALLVIVGACGTSNDERLRSPVGGPADPTTTVVDPATTTAASSTTVASDEPPPTTTTLPGEPWDFAIAGTVADVAGVAFDEVFVIRTAPGADQPVAASLPPLTQLVLTGRGRELDEGQFSAVWLEATAGSVTGWIPRNSLVYLSASQDITADIAADIEAEVGVGGAPPTMLELGTLVTDAFSRVPPPEIILAAEPSAGTTSEVVYDVFPDEAFGDDTTNGSRLRITGRQAPIDDLPETGFASALGYELVSVETSSLCRRGVDTSTGFCV